MLNCLQPCAILSKFCCVFCSNSWCYDGKQTWEESAGRGSVASVTASRWGWLVEADVPARALAQYEAVVVACYRAAAARSPAVREARAAPEPGACAAAAAHPFDIRQWLHFAPSRSARHCSRYNWSAHPAPALCSHWTRSDGSALQARALRPSPTSVAGRAPARAAASRGGECSRGTTRAHDDRRWATGTRRPQPPRGIELHRCGSAWGAASGTRTAARATTRALRRQTAAAQTARPRRSSRRPRRHRSRRAPAAALATACNKHQPLSADRKTITQSGMLCVMYMYDNMINTRSEIECLY